jgi:hypothetical protein
MTQEPNPGATPPPTWTPDAGQPAASQPAPAATPAPYAAPAQPAYAAPPAQPSTSFAPAPVSPTISSPQPKNRASAGTAILLLGALVAIGGVAFAVGRVTAPTTSATAGRGNGAGGAGFGGGFGPGASGNPGGAFGGGFGRGGGGVNVTGTVVSIDANTIEVKLSTGNTVTLNLGSSTTYRTATTGSASDVAAGDTVELGLSVGTRQPGASAQPRPSGGTGGGFGGFGGFGGGTVSTVTVVK